MCGANSLIHRFCAPSVLLSLGGQATLMAFDGNGVVQLRPGVLVSGNVLLPHGVVDEIVVVAGAPGIVKPVKFGSELAFNIGE